MWIDTIVAYEPDARLVAIKNVSLAEEHLHDHLPPSADGTQIPVMPASLMVEGMAQTAGILVGAARGFREKVILAKVAKARFDFDVVPGDTIRYDAVLERIDDLGASTHGTVSVRCPRAADPDAWHDIGEVNLMFSHVDQNMAGLEFPEENFVFSGNLKAILETADLPPLPAT
jgi:3-hydroxyacyl-[acyl-carrier-protein] dehydratase